MCGILGSGCSDESYNVGICRCGCPGYRGMACCCPGGVPAPCHPCDPTPPPTDPPTAAPTVEPTSVPTAEPTAEPTSAPTAKSSVPTADSTSETTEPPWPPQSSGDEDGDDDNDDVIIIGAVSGVIILVLVVARVRQRAQNETRRLPPVAPANNPAFDEPQYAAMNYEEVGVPPLPGRRALDEDEYVVGSNQMNRGSPLYAEPTPVETNA